MSVAETPRQIVQNLIGSEIPDEDYVLVEDVVENEMPRLPSNEEILGCLVAVDGIPTVDDSRKDKLIGILLKKFSCPEGSKVAGAAKFALQKENISIPMGENGKSKGFCFVEFSSSADAEKASRLIHGRHLDSKHTFRTILLASLDRYSNIPEEFVAAPEPEYEETPDYQSWLLNKQCLDQFVMYHEHMTSVMWNTKGASTPVVEREHWTQHYVSWSPRGSFLATVHQQGIALWGGDDWSKILRLEHPGVQLLDFSPCEKYLCTWSNEIKDDRDNPRTIIIWDVRTGAKLRGFTSGVGAEHLNWPVFKWSHDDKYVARAGPDFITIYELPTMKTLVKGEKKTLEIPGLKDFSWSPSDNTLAYWMPEHGHSPARVVLVDIPSKQEVRAKNLFNVDHAVLHWQEAGDYLCVKVDSRTKNKKEFASFELFRIREKGVPVDTIEVKDQVHAFAWEPVAHRFCIIHGGESNIHSISIYTLMGGKGNTKQIKCLATEDKKPYHTIFWSPKGRYFVLANLRGVNRAFEFWDAETCTVLNQGEHYMASRVEWDPTGRYVATSVSAWTEPTEHSYFLWSSQGRLLQRVMVNKMYQFAWRPRPKCVLTKAEIKEVKAKLKSQAELFDREDREAIFKVSEGERQLRLEQLGKWEALVAKITEARAEREGDYEALQKLYEEQGGPWAETEETVESLVDTKVVVVD